MKLKILYIEDNVNDHLILKRTLAKAGLDFELKTCTHGVDGLREILENKFDLVILDYKLPDMSGLDLLEEIKRQRLKTPVIFVTGKGDEKVAVEAMKKGAVDYIVKNEINSSRILDSLKNQVIRFSLPPDVPLEFIAYLARVYEEHDEIKIEQFNSVKLDPPLDFPTRTSINSLEKLKEARILSKKPLRTSVFCSSCASYELETFIKCPKCGDSILTRGESLQHFSCGFVDFRSKFVNEKSELVCLKCGKALHQIGVDYSKVGQWYKCAQEHVFSSPIIGYKCRDCGKEFDLESAQLEIIHSYSLTEEGKVALELTSIKSKEPHKQLAVGVPDGDTGV